MPYYPTASEEAEERAGELAEMIGAVATLRRRSFLLREMHSEMAKAILKLQGGGSKSVPEAIEILEAARRKIGL